jgi:threonine dehydratase
MNQPAPTPRMLPTMADVRSAAERIRPHAHRTPVLTCHALDELCGGRLFFKCENFQKAGAFKFRGATNAVFSLAPDEAECGVLTHSSGNHGAALALAARMRGIPACVVVPTNAPTIKRAAIAGYGARIVDCEPTLAAREATAARVLAETGATLIHPYDDDRIIAGQGTAALELLEDVPGLDAVLAPVGGGGLVSGTAIAVKGLSPATDVYAAEPAGADDALRSLRAGRIIPQTDPRTVADGLRTSLAPRTFAVIQELVKDILTVTEDEIIWAMRHVLERMKIVIEPSSAVPVAAVLVGRLPAKGRRVGIILSGGNVDWDNLPWVRSR